MKGIRLIMVIGCLLASHSALAATTTGTVNVNLILSNSCVVNGSTATTGVPMGTLDFGTQPTTFSQLITQLSNNAGTTFTVQCPPNDTFTVALTSSTNTAPTTPHGTQIGSTPRYVNLANNSHGVYYGVLIVTHPQSQALPLLIMQQLPLYQAQQMASVPIPYMA